MSTVQTDPLYQVFESHLHSGLYDVHPVELFLRDVVEAYFVQLKGGGFVPHNAEEHLRQDLAQDVFDMLKIKIYGHVSIAAYNQARKR